MYLGTVCKVLQLFFSKFITWYFSYKNDQNPRHNNSKFIYMPHKSLVHAIDKLIIFVFSKFELCAGHRFECRVCQLTPENPIHDISLFYQMCNKDKNIIRILFLMIVHKTIILFTQTCQISSKYSNKFVM